jgi:hypothetical protein
VRQEAYRNIHTLTNLSAILDKARAHAEARKIGKKDYLGG